MTRTIDALRAIVARLDDDALARRVACECYDQLHDDRWCPTCAAREDGIDAYRDAIRDGEAAE